MNSPMVLLQLLVLAPMFGFITTLESVVFWDNTFSFGTVQFVLVQKHRHCLQTTFTDFNINVPIFKFLQKCRLTTMQFYSDKIGFCRKFKATSSCSEHKLFRI